MSKMELRRKARTLWSNPVYQRAWLRSVLTLGDKWLLATPVKRNAQAQ
jgi:hypothetical protein